MTDNLQERNEQSLNDIKSLQTNEMKLYDSLENNKLLTKLIKYLKCALICMRI